MLRSGIFWISGEAGAGKTQLAHGLYLRLKRINTPCEVVDEAEVASTLGSDVSPGGRTTQLMYVARALAKNGIWAIVAARSPDPGSRAQARAMADASGIPFFLVHADCPKELAQARRGGASAEPYHVPEDKDLITAATENRSPHDLADMVVGKLLRRFEWNPPTLLLAKSGSRHEVLSSLMQDLGIFLGRPQDLSACGDSLYWIELVHRLAKEAGVQRALPSGEKYRKEIQDYAVSFLRDSEVPLGTQWSFMVPETALVFPLFLDAFPASKCVHLTRHPVAACMASGSLDSEPLHPLGRLSLPAAYQDAGIDPGRAWHDESWVRNAVVYRHEVGRAIYYARAILPKDRYLELRLEDVVERPDDALLALSRYLGITPQRPSASGNMNSVMTDPWGHDDIRVDPIWDAAGQIGTLLGYRKELPD